MKKKAKLGPYHGKGKGRIDEDVETAPIDRTPVRQKHGARRIRRRVSRRR